MELYLQMGHGMKAMAEELIKSWGQGTAIISPVNMPQDKIAAFAEKIHKTGGDVLFDPQMFYPKEGHIKLREYDYWPQEGVSVSTENGYRFINQGLLRINNEIGSSAIILPGKEISEESFAYGIDWLGASAAYFREKTDKPLLATICLFSETIRNPDSLERLVEDLKSIDVDGYYVVPHPSNNEYIVGDPLWTIGIMKLLSCLKLQKRIVVVGYSNHQGLMYSLAHIDGLATGTYMNTRSFVPSKFKFPKDMDVKQKSVWYYLPTALCEYKVTSLDVAMQRGFISEFAPHETYANEYSAMLFRGAIPSSTNYREGHSFRHYFHCMKEQCAMLSLSSYKDVYNTYEVMLRTSEALIERIKNRGISGQNRDFHPAIEANRVAMCANNEDYGLKLTLDWDL